MKAIIISGTRDVPRSLVPELSDVVVDLVNELGQWTVMVHGDARGVDTVASDAWRGVGRSEPLAMPAPWEEYRQDPAKRVSDAGKDRNEDMLRVLLALERCGYDIAVHAFPGPSSRGTWHMVNIAKAAGVKVVLHDTLRGGS